MQGKLDAIEIVFIACSSRRHNKKDISLYQESCMAFIPCTLYYSKISKRYVNCPNNKVLYRDVKFQIFEIKKFSVILGIVLGISYQMNIRSIDRHRINLTK